MNSDTIQILVGQFVRTALNILSAFLVGNGVNQSQADSLTASAVPVVAGLIIFAGSQVWSYISKRNALNTPPPA